MIEVEIDISVLRRTVGWESKRRFLSSRATFKTKGEYKAKKDIVHSIRYLLFAMQLVEYVL